MFGNKVSRLGAVSGRAPTQRAIALLRRKNATIWPFGVGTVQGLQALDYLASDLAALTTVDGLVGGIKDSLGGTLNALQATAGSRPTLRRGVVNLLIQSNTPSNAAWTTTVLGGGSTPVVTGNKVVFAAPISGDGSFLQTGTAAISAGATYTFAIDIQAFGAGDIGKQLLYRGVAGAGYQTVTLTAALQRITVAESTAATSSVSSLGLRPALGGSSGTVSCNIFNAQLETGSVAHAYVPTTSAPASSASGAFWLSTNGGSNPLTATLPAGHESDIVIDAVTGVGATVLTGQNLTGAYSVYGGISATELVSNPGPFSATTGWNAASGGSLSVSAGNLVLTSGAGGYGGENQAITCVVGHTYDVTWTAPAATANTYYLQIGNAPGAAAMLNLTRAPGSFSATFVASVTAVYVSVIASSAAGSTVAVAALSVREVLPGTSGRLILPGTVAAPATLTAGETALLTAFANRLAGL